MRQLLSAEEALMIVHITGNGGMAVARRGIRQIMGAGGIADEAGAIARGFIIGMGLRDEAVGALMFGRFVLILLPAVITGEGAGNGANAIQRNPVLAFAIR